jgi:hypothetical protein
MWECQDAVDEAGNGCFEDRAGVKDTLAWVLDGASSVFPERITGPGFKSDAAWLVDQLAHHLDDVAGDDVPLEKLVSIAIERTAAVAQTAWSAVPEVPPSAALGVIRRRGVRTEFLVLADVSVILRTDAGAVELIDRRVDRINRRAQDQMDRAVLRAGATFESVRQVTQPLLHEARRQGMNQEGGYWVASTDPAAVDHAYTGAIDGVREAILASDGFMRAVHLFGLVDDVADLFRCDMVDLAAAIRVAERADPDTREYPRWSVSDDICARRLVWSD